MGKSIKLIEPTKAHLSRAERLERELMKEELEEYPMLNEKAPTYLKGEALKEWKRIIPLLKEDVPVSELDYSLLAAYCSATGTVVDCQKELNKSGLIVEGKTNPIIRVQSQAIKDMRMLANTLGISLDGRMKVALKGGKEKTVDPLEALMLDD